MAGPGRRRDLVREFQVRLTRARREKVREFHERCASDYERSREIFVRGHKGMQGKESLRVVWEERPARLPREAERLRLDLAARRAGAGRRLSAIP